MSRPLARVAGILTALVATVGLAACGSDSSAAGGAPASVRVGYFPNVTHATGIVADKEGFFAKHLGATKLEVKTFNAGPAAMEALKSGAIDATYVGPGPATNAYINSGGQAVTVVAGAATGGTSFVVDPSIRTAADLKGKKVSTPQLGNTQDIALKKWLIDNGLTAGDAPDAVKIANLDNPRTLDAFKQGSVDGGWLPEPWSSRLVLEAGASVLVDEATLWPNGKFPTTVLLVRTEFLNQYPDTVRALLRGHLKAIDEAAAKPDEAKAVVNQGLQKLTGKALEGPVIDRAFQNITLDPDPLAATFPQLAKDSATAGVTDQPTDVAGLLDVAPLNAELQAAGKSPVDAAGLDRPGNS